ncbi:APC family permease [Nonomuraea sp. NPDC050663]|uniref:APC family permease n=1 Tax=Nonomuraea sp. NPDC050663 TaxID=3364370 RepID=UPI00379DA39E
MSDALARRLSTSDAVTVGLSAMIGAGVFAAFAPAAGAAGSWLPAALALAAVVAYCNATSSARLAALYPASGGTYVYGRKRLGDFWGYLAGWGFVVGKTASCAAMALTFGAYVAPALARPLAVGAVVALTVLNLFGVERSARVARVLVAFVLAVLAVVVTAAFLAAPAATEAQPGSDPGLTGVLQGAGLLFFAFAGYARIATLGEEVREPQAIPRAINISLAVTLTLYALVAAAALTTLGPVVLAGSAMPLADVARAAQAGWLVPVVVAGAAVASLGALLALILGVSRTVLAMARERDLPSVLAAVHPVRQVPYRAELAVGATVIVLTLVADLRGAIGFSSFGVLVYYAVANAAAFTMSREEGGPVKAVPVAGFVLCLVLAATLPWRSVVAGLVVFAVGILLRMMGASLRRWS